MTPKQEASDDTDSIEAALEQELSAQSSDLSKPAATTNAVEWEFGALKQETELSQQMQAAQLCQQIANQLTSHGQLSTDIGMTMY